MRRTVPQPTSAAMQQCVSSCALLSQRFLILAVAAALHGVGHQNDAEDDHEHDGGQRVDLRADLFTGHGVDGNGQGLYRAAVEVGDHEIIDGIGQADEEGRQDSGADLRQNDLEDSFIFVVFIVIYVLTTKLNNTGIISHTEHLTTM